MKEYSRKLWFLSQSCPEEWRCLGKGWMMGSRFQSAKPRRLGSEEISQERRACFAGSESRWWRRDVWKRGWEGKQARILKAFSCCAVRLYPISIKKIAEFKHNVLEVWSGHSSAVWWRTRRKKGVEETRCQAVPVLRVRGRSPQTDVAAKEMTQLDGMKKRSRNNLNWINDWLHRGSYRVGFPETQCFIIYL